MLRFRNRFKGEGSLRVCPDCGGRISVTVGDGREAQIHEFPLCEPFKAWMALVSCLPSGKLHEVVAVMADDAEAPKEFELIEFDGMGSS